VARNYVDIVIRAITGNAKKEIGDVSKALGTIGKSKAGIDSVTGAIGGMVGAFGVLAAGAGSALVAFKALSSGAELDRLAEQFDNVATHAGYLPDVLLGDLRAATHGMMTDAELMRSALDIMQLGLSDSQQGVVDLATVVSTLGLDMQQVILTLTNNSTMRLDALGLSVEGVTRRVEELNRQHFEGDAFDQAVIEALQDRVAVLGNAWETTAGKLDITGTAITNLFDTIKRRAADSALFSTALDIVKQAADTTLLLVTAEDQINQALRDTGNAMMAATDTYDDYLTAKAMLLDADGQLAPAERELINDYIAGNVVLPETVEHVETLMAALGVLTEEQYNAAKGAESYDHALTVVATAAHDAAMATDGLAGSVKQAQAALRDWSKEQIGQEALSNIQQAFGAGAISAMEYRAALQEIGVGYLGMSQAQVDASLAIAAISQSFRDTHDIETYLSLLGDVNGLLSSIPDETTTHIRVVYDEEGLPESLTTQYTGGAPNKAKRNKTGHGSAFAVGTPPGGIIVPPGYPSDTYPIYVSSGERVIVYPAGSQAASGNAGNTINISAPVTVYGGGNDGGAIGDAVQMALVTGLQASGVV